MTIRVRICNKRIVRNQKKRQNPTIKNMRTIIKGFFSPLGCFLPPYTSPTCSETSANRSVLRKSIETLKKVADPLPVIPNSGCASESPKECFRNIFHEVSSTTPSPCSSSCLLPSPLDSSSVILRSDPGIYLGLCCVCLSSPALL